MEKVLDKTWQNKCVVGQKLLQAQQHTNRCRVDGQIRPNIIWTWPKLYYVRATSSAVRWSAGALPEHRRFLVGAGAGAGAGTGAGAGVGVLSPSSGWKVRMTRNVTISKKLWLQIMATLNLLKVHII